MDDSCINLKLKVIVLKKKNVVGDALLNTNNCMKSMVYQPSTANYQLTLFPLKNSSTFIRFLPSS